MVYNKESVLQKISEERVKFATVSGVLTTKPGIIEWVDREIPEIEIITTKSYQVRPNAGYREPIIVEADYGCFGNAVGLRNPGMEQGAAELRELRRRRELRALLNVSLSASSPEDFAELIRNFEEVADLLELNFSCPHAADGYGASIGSSEDLVWKYISIVRGVTEKPLFVKLTPNVDNIGSIARAAVEAGADGITAINTVGPDVYTEPYTGEPVLSNPKGHKGGKSGVWIRETALEKIGQVQAAVGRGVPIIGMGGVSDSSDAGKLREAGADVVGLGTVFARVRQSEIPAFLRGLKQDSEKLQYWQQPVGTADVEIRGETNRKQARSFVSEKRVAEYKRFTVSRVAKAGNLKLFTLDGAIPAEASQYAFLWVPGTGEKPFSIVKSDPLTFLVREREFDPDHGKGLLTHALFDLVPGDTVMVRGPYGRAVKPVSGAACIVAGGTGTALVPLLYEHLTQTAREVAVRLAMRSEAESELLQNCVVEDVPARLFVDEDNTCTALRELKRELTGSGDGPTPRSGDLHDTVYFNVGPLPFMEYAAAIEQEAGAGAESIYLSLETNTMCGVGLCGECACGDTLTCQEGTFLSLTHIKHHNIDLHKLLEVHPAGRRAGHTVPESNNQPDKTLLVKR
jgi:dihydroorotate dehydrogenase (NAD+) catalytic subunit